MITVSINGGKKQLNDVTPEWINQQINRRQAFNESVCVQVSIDESDYKMSLSTPICGGGAGGGRQPTSKEAELFSLWNKCGLSSMSFTGGELESFLMHLRRLL